MDSDHLYVNESLIPNSGRGLFTKKQIEKGELIIEYTGEETNWEAVRYDATNVYIYFVNEDRVINAKDFPDAIARYANDAHGLKRVKGMNNNSRFVNVNGKIFIKATRQIRANAEILVNYGRSYWQTVRRNDEINASRRGRK